MEAQTCKRELVIDVPAEVVQREAQKVTGQYARAARLPGFRPGHAPSSLVRRRFKDEIKSEVVQALVPKFFKTSLDDRKWVVAGEPEFVDLKFPEDQPDQPLTIKATFEIYPEFELKVYKGLQLEEQPATVSEADVDQALEAVRENAAITEVVTDRPAQDGDYVSFNYQGHDAKEPDKALVEQHDALILLAGEGTHPAFTENLRGTNAGDVRTFEVTYPEDYAGRRVAGKTVIYRGRVESIKRKVLPPLDDELAKSVSDFSTLEELRAKVRKDVEDAQQRRAEKDARHGLLEKLVAAHEFPVPEILVEQQTDRRLEGLITELVRQGIDPKQTAVDWRKLREESRLEAEKDVRGRLILAKIAETEKIEVTEAEVDETIRELAAIQHETPAALKTRLTSNGGLARIESTRRTQKALDFVYNNAQIIRKSE
ncbi:MAG TPA: trigger factor [Terriglobia bacterium]|nr:trigger factor [Terriglobia bacterium]